MFILIAMLAGAALGLFIPWNIPATLTPFLAMGLMAACNTLFGGVYAQMKHRFDARTFISGFFFNTILAMLLTFAGSKLGVDFSIAAIVYFGTRIFNNIAKIQHYILQKEPGGVKIKEIGDARQRPLGHEPKPSPPAGEDEE